MIRSKRCALSLEQSMQPASHLTASTRRANTIVFVMSILVLLVIVGTAFVTRARSGRQIATAQQAASGRDGRAHSLARDVAKEISASLFPKPIDPTDAFGQLDFSTTPPTKVGSASWPRLATPAYATRFETDRDFDNDAFPDFPTNTTPFEVKPWTNWPDDFDSPNSAWPRGAGAPTGQLLTLLGAPMGDSNPYGNPGTGDTRWLRSTEPQRADFDGDGVPDGFSHWTHLTWLPTANNAWRAVRDISDIEGTTLINLKQTDLTKAFGVAVPYEQWLPNVLPTPFASATDIVTNFPARRDEWFAPPSQANWYGVNYRLPSALPNFFQLAALGPVSDEYQPNTARQMITRTFADADGDGYTDSFWFLAPTPVDRGVRTIVGISIVDNSSMLNVNVATKGGFFETTFDASGNMVPAGGTTGQTPADLALVWSKNDLQNRAGLLDTPINSANDYSDPATTPYFPDYFPSLWSGQGAQLFRIGNGTSVNASMHMGRGPNGLESGSADLYGDISIIAPGANDFSVLKSLGVKDINVAQQTLANQLGFPLVDPDVALVLPQQAGRFELASERLAWFKLAGVDPNGALASTLGLRPFSAADEVELRMAAGLNQPYTNTRLEQAFSLFSPTVLGVNANRFQMLRATVQREEANRALEPLSQRELLVDMRHRLTTVNGARNDQLPSWLWPTPFYHAKRNYLHPRNAAITDTDDPLFAQFDAENRAEYARQKLKVDLRRPMFALEDGTAVGTAVREAREQQWRNDIARLLERSVSFYGDRDGDGTTDFWRSYLDSIDPTATEPDEQYLKTLSMIASYTANLHAASDQPVKAPGSAVTVWYDPPMVATPAGGNPESQFKPSLDHVVFDPNTPGRFYNGMEKQPFIMEVFLGVVYPKSKIYPNDWNAEFAMCGPVESITSPQLKLPTTVADGGGETFVDDTSKPAAVIAVQIANPYDTPLPLFDFEIQFYGRPYSFATGPYGFVPVLPPATSAGPATAIIYAVPDYIYSDTAEASTPPANPASAETELLISTKMLDFLDIEYAPTDVDGDGDANGTYNIREHIGLYDSHPTGATDPFDAQDRTLVFNATGAWHCKQNDPIAATYQSNTTEPVVLIRRVATPGGVVRMVVDRLENDVSGDEESFRTEVRRLFNDPQLQPPAKKYKCRMAEKEVDGIRLGANDLFMTYARCARPWMWDPQSWVRDPSTGQWASLASTANATSICSRDVDSWEINPRFVFSTHSQPIRSGSVSAGGSVVGRPWDGIIDGGDVDFVGDAMSLVAADDPDNNNGSGSGPKRSLWPRTTFMDIFGRNLRAKPVFFSMQTVTAEEDCTNPQPNAVHDAVYMDGSGPLPFLRNAETLGAVIPSSSNGIGHSRITYNGANYDVVVGNKGSSSQDWLRWLDNAIAPGAERYASLRNALQLTQKDDDFEQVGEVLDVFLWGHVYENPGASPTCVATFSEIMLNADPASDFPAGKGPFVNRLHARAPGEQSIFDLAGNLVTYDPGTPVLGARWYYPDTPPNAPAENDLSFVAGQPALPMGLSWMDALACDGFGRGTLDRDGDNDRDAVDDAWLERRRFALAGDYMGTKTPGLVNINTAPIEVLRALPLMTRLPKYDLTNPTLPWVYNRIPDAMIKYREGTVSTDNSGNPFITDVIRPSTMAAAEMPSYSDRGLTQDEVDNVAGGPVAMVPGANRFYPGMRAEKGFASSSELLLMRRTALTDPTVAMGDLSIRQSYSSQFFALDPYDLTYDPNSNSIDPGEFLNLAIQQVPGYRFSIDRAAPKARFAPLDTLQASFPALLNLPVRWDEPLGDAEDATLAYKAISNLVSTRSDVFTVYLKVRQVKQDPVTRRWDATKSEHVIDDSRFVMVVDRSECNAPSDQPKILFFEKCSTN